MEITQGKSFGETALRLEAGLAECVRLRADNNELREVVIRQAQQLQAYMGRKTGYVTDDNGVELHTLSCDCGRCERNSQISRLRETQRAVELGESTHKAS